MSGPDEPDGDVPPPPRWYGSGASSPGPASEPGPVEDPHGESATAESAHTDPSAWQQAREQARQEREAEQPGEVPPPAEAAREVGSAWFGRDLIEPGPGWPFGRRARQRRERRQQARQRTKDRREALRQGLDPDREPAPLPHRWSPVDPTANAKAIASLAGVVAVVLGAAWWFTSDEPPQRTAAAPPAAPAPPPSPPPAPPGPPTGQGTALPKVEPIPPGGVAPIAPPAATPPADPAAVRLVPTPSAPPSADELSTPESAATAWFARWCGFDARQPYGASEQAARPAMTAMGWDSIDPAGNERGQRSWDETVAAGEVGRCSAAAAQISPEAPRSEDSAIVAISGQRVVTAEAAPDYVEPVDETRIVKRETDGSWRVDAATRGG